MASPDTPLASRFLQARHYRIGVPPRPVDWIVLHSTEGDGSALSIAEWFASDRSPTASTHYVVDAGDVVQCVGENHIAWHAPPANPQSIGIEHCGWAHWGTAEWPAALRERSAALVADICRRHSLPAVYLDSAALLRGERGITTHRQVSLAWHKSSHWDPGDGLDAPGLVEMVAARLSGGAPVEVALAADP